MDDNSIPKWVIVTLIVTFVIGLIFLAIGNVNHNVNQEKTAGNKVILGLGYILVAPGIAVISIYAFLNSNQS